MTFEEILYTMGTAIAGGIGWFFASNEKLREGISDWFLKSLNQTRIKKIPLKQHKLFSLLKQKESSMTYFVIDEPIKIEFYRRYVGIVFAALRKSALDIVEAAEDRKTVMSNFIDGEINELPSRITHALGQQLVIPPSIYKNFMQWRMMINDSLKDTLTEVLNDDLVKSNYFIAYRTLDTLIAHAKFILSSGALEFSRMNGAFRGLETKDILRHDNQSTSKQL